MKNSTLGKALGILKKSGILNRKFNDFEELYDAVKKLLVPAVFKGDGLAIYDIALRLGQLFNPKIEPRDYVYLSCGAKKAAEALLGRKVKFREPISVFDPYFPGCSATDIEDILCIYKEDIINYYSAVKTLKP